MKTIERAHLPNRWWERILLPQNYAKALEIVDKQLMYWPKFLVHRNKQRLTRLTQVAIRTRKLAKEEERLGEKMVPKLRNKIRRKEEIRERKALSAAKVERAIERELIERLRTGAYSGGEKETQPLNIDEKMWKKVLRALEKGGDAEREEDQLEDEEEEGEYEYEREGAEPEVEYVSDLEGESDEEEPDDLEDWLGSDEDSEDASEEDEEVEDEDDDEADEENDDELKKKLAGLKRKRPSAPSKPARPTKKKSTKGPKVNIEYEYEKEPPRREMLRA